MAYSGGSDGEGMVFEYEDSSVQPRKRQRLTHLSPGEKLQRRKLKNRVAAQAARDRRKAYMDELEEQLADLRVTNKRLLEENTLLRAQRCPQCNSSVNKTDTAIPASVKLESTSKSAVLSPQQKEQIQVLLALIALCSLISPKNCRSCTHTCKKTMSNVNMQEPLDLSLKSSTLHQLQNIFLQWWGPQQSCWNPSETI